MLIAKVETGCVGQKKVGFVILRRVIRKTFVNVKRGCAICGKFVVAVFAVARREGYEIKLPATFIEGRF